MSVVFHRTNYWCKFSRLTRTNCWLQRFLICTDQDADCSVSRFARNKLLVEGLQTYIAQTTNCDVCRVAPIKLSIEMFQPWTEQGTGFGVSSIHYRQYLLVLPWYLKNIPVSFRIPRWKLLLCMDPNDWVCKKMVNMLLLTLTHSVLHTFSTYTEALQFWAVWTLHKKLLNIPVRKLGKF